MEQELEFSNKAAGRSHPFRSLWLAFFFFLGFLDFILWGCIHFIWFRKESLVYKVTILPSLLLVPPCYPSKIIISSSLLKGSNFVDKLICNRRYSFEAASKIFSSSQIFLCRENKNAYSLCLEWELNNLNEVMNS